MVSCTALRAGVAWHGAVLVSGRGVQTGEEDRPGRRLKQKQGRKSRWEGLPGQDEIKVVVCFA